MSRKYNKILIPRAKDLRNNMTPQEKHIWYDFLVKYPVRFQRQKTIGNFIADFYCAKAKLIVEIDGSQHYTEEGFINDSVRMSLLNDIGLSVIRFSNHEIEKHFNSVCRMIDETVKSVVKGEKLPPSRD